MSKISRARYYEKAFECLEKEHKHTWNWAAFCFGSIWMLYRKMYLYGILGNIICYLYFSFANVYMKSVTESKSFLYYSIAFICFHIVLSILYGCFGDRLYYRVVKDRIKKGYHLQNKYSPTSIVTALPEILISSIFACFSASLFALSNFLCKPNQSEISKDSNDLKVNEENIIKYLKNGDSHTFRSFVFALLLFALGLHNTSHKPLLFGNLQLIMDNFEALSEYEEFESERDILSKTEKDLQDKELNSSILSIFAPAMLISACENDNEFAKNHLENLKTIFYEYSKKLEARDDYAREIRKKSLHILDILKSLIVERREDVIKYITENSNYDLNFALSEMDKVLNIDSEIWEKAMLFMMNEAKFNRKSQVYLKLAEKGDAESQSKLGRYYIKGFVVSPKGIDHNGEEGLIWLKKASEQNVKIWSGYASYRIAIVYTYGEAGIQQDYKEANKWLEKAIEQGYNSAIYNLAINYHLGLGVKKDLEKAKELLKKSIEKGDKRGVSLYNSLTNGRLECQAPACCSK